MKTPKDLNKNSKIERMDFFISLFQNSPTPKTISSLSTKKYVYVNPSWELFTGFSKKEAIGKTVLELNLVSIESVILIREKLLKEKEVISYDCSIRLKNGIEKEILMSFDNISIDGEDFIINTINDIDELDKFKKRLEELNEFSEGLIKSMHEGVLMFDLDYKIIGVNPAFTKITGYSEEELLGLEKPFPFSPPEMHEIINEHYTLLINNALDYAFESIYMRKNGERYPVSILISSIKDKSGNKIAHFATIVDITNRIKAQEELRVAKEYSENLLKSLQQGLTVVNYKGELIDVNSKFCEMAGFTREELIGKKLPFPYWPPEEIDYMKSCLEKTLDGEMGEFEFMFMRKNGERFPVALKTSFIKDEKGLGQVFFATIEDITDRKKAEELLIKSERYLDNIINNIGDPLFVKDNDSRLLLVNNAFCTIFNLSREDIIGKTLAEDVTPEERESFLCIDKQVISTGIENVNEETLTVRDEETRIISTKKTRYVDDSGNKFLIGVIRDVTEGIKTREELKTAKEFSEGLIKSMHEGLVVFNLQTEIISVNPSFCEMSGFTEKELIGKSCPYPFSPPEIEEEANIRHEKLTRGEFVDSFESVYMQKNGTRFNVDVQISSIWDEDKSRIAYFGTVIDITKRKKTEIELKAAKEFSDKLIMSMQEGLLIVNLEGKILMVNDSTCKILGYSKEELIGLNLPYPFVKIEDFEEITRTNEKVARGEAPLFQFEFIKKNGEKFLASFLTGNIKNNKGEVIALFGTMKDISEEHKVKKTLEDIAIKSTKKKDVILKLASLVGEDFISSLKNITKEAAETLNVERVSIWSFNFDKSEIYCEKLYTLNNESYANGFVIKNTDNAEYFKALEESQTILVSDAQKNSITKKFAQEYLIPNNIKSLMDVFINSTNGYYGIICFEHVGDTNRNWTADEQEFATSIANIVSIMVESNERKIAENKIAKANEQLIEANKELSLLRNQLEQENIYLRNELDLVFNYEEMVYGSAEFSDVLTEVEKVAPTNATVLLLGESGTGKELLARAIHNIGLRNKKPLIKVNCSAIPRELIESELFGHKKGSFTGAFNDKVGKFELADGGTLFLDEIGELPLDMQPKILRFLQEGEIEVVGGTGLKKLDVRVIAATNRNLKEEIEKKQFREDLYFRLHVFPIEVPSLRKRKNDIPLLVEHFVDKFNKAYAKNIKYIPDDSMSKLKSYDWPGNIRELENLIERASILSTSETLFVPGFESETQKSKLPINSKNLSLDLAQRNHILQVLEQCNWKISGPNGAAVLLDLKPSTLRDKMAKLGIIKPLSK